jgi:1-acyl-sn-glycerol-3-phosphate acyltransferase
MLRAILHAFFRFLFAVIAHVDVQGKEYIPASGGAILASNHVSIVDAPLVFAVVDRKDLTALVADKYVHNWLIGPLVKAVNGIWINREEADVHALRAARDYLRQGHALGIAPEGTRSSNATLLPAKTGVAYLADRAGATIVPVAIWGTETAFSQLKRLRRPHIHIHFGPAFTLPPLERGDRAAALERNTDLIMCRIAVMLPPEYRGAYAAHPCLAGMHQI